ncbi:MAG: isochorismatase family protein [Verrucomicrobia bacterium]|nr:isochorismatase family protein [Verrucomicrobiota bacterium]MBV8279397.1 isochorismatase family protein [Verrucomicrobiota bacterium]
MSNSDYKREQGAGLPRSVLLVIDVQDSFKGDAATWATRNNPAFESNVTKLIEAYRAAGLPIVFLLHQNLKPESNFNPNSPFYRFMDFVVPRPEEVVLQKTTISAFASTDLARRLTQWEINHLRVTGIQTEQCCETTTRDASDRGYKVDFVTDATLTFAIPHWAGGPELPTDQVVRRTEYALAGRFASIVSTEEVLGLLR